MKQMDNSLTVNTPRREVEKLSSFRKLSYNCVYNLVIANFKMRLFDKIFGRQKFDLEILVPTTIEIVHMDDKVRFRGTKEDISKFSKEFYRLKELNDGQLCKLDKYTLKVSDYITPDREKENWIELPNHAWGIMGSKFNEVPYEYEDNPFDFNDCGYTVCVRRADVQTWSFVLLINFRNKLKLCAPKPARTQSPKTLAVILPNRMLNIKKYNPMKL